MLTLKSSLISKSKTFLFPKCNLYNIIQRAYPGPDKLTVSVLRNNAHHIIPKYPTFTLPGLPPIKSITKLCKPVVFNKMKKHVNGDFSIDKMLNNKKLIQNLNSLLEIKPLIKEKKTKNLKTFSNKEYTTLINENTTINDMSDEQLIEELKKRELVKEDSGKTAVTIKLQDNSDFVLGLSKNKIKLSGLGQAYYEKFVNQPNIIQDTVLDQTSTSQLNFIIIVPPKSSENLLLETGKQKHMLVVVDENNNFYAIGYLTSKNTGVFVNDKQLKDFQCEKENMVKTQNKTQYLNKFKTRIKIEADDIKRVKWDTEYLQTLPLKEFQLLYIALNKKVYELFNKDGLTKEECLRICKDHDKIASTEGKIKHPLTAEQIKLNESNKYKQQNKLVNKNENTFNNVNQD